jgi:competence protein ComEC
VPRVIGAKLHPPAGGSKLLPYFSSLQTLAHSKLFSIFVQSHSLQAVLHKEIPFLRIGLPFCLGIIAGLYFNPGTFFWIVSVLIISACFILSFRVQSYEENQLFGYTLTLALFVTGIFLYKNEKTRISVFDQKESVFICTLSDFPEEKEKSLRIVVNLSSIVDGNKTAPARGSILLYNRKDKGWKDARPGDQIILRCTPVEIVNRGNPYEFNYKFYMENHGIKYYAFTDSSNILAHRSPESRKLVHRALILRERIIRMYSERGITGNNLALVAAITMGQKRMLDPEQKQSFMKAGVMHIMAVSGLHAVILSMIVLNILFFLKGRFNILRITLTLLVLWSFAFVTGLTPSVLRAVLMFSFLQAGKLMKRPVNAINSVLASAFLLAILKPSVIFDAGFLLSYSAVIYIIIFYKRVYEVVDNRNFISDRIWQLVSVSIVAQAGTLPLTIMYFNRFPVYFLLANIIIVPLSTLLIIIGCLIPLTYTLAPVSFFLGALLNRLTTLTETITVWISSLPGATWENIGLTIPSAIIMTFTIFISCYFFLYRRSISILYPFSSLLLLVLAGTITEMSTRRTNDVIVYNCTDRYAVGIRAGKLLNIYSDSIGRSMEVDRHSAMRRLEVRMNETVRENCIYNAGGNRILIGSFLNCDISEMIAPDIVVLTGSRPRIDRNLKNCKIPSELVFTSARSGFLKIAPEEYISRIDSVHFIRDGGAFISALKSKPNKNPGKVEF